MKRQLQYKAVQHADDAWTEFTPPMRFTNGDVDIREVVVFEVGDTFITPNGTLTFTVSSGQLAFGVKGGDVTEYVDTLVTNNDSGDTYPQYTRSSRLLEWNYEGDVRG